MHDHRQPVIGGLRTVPGETLYLRLAVHLCNFPASHPREDYVFRCDLWEIVHKELRAEIARRKVPPPQWWPRTRVASVPLPRPPRAGLIFTYCSIAVLVVIAGTRIF